PVAQSATPASRTRRPAAPRISSSTVSAIPASRTQRRVNPPDRRRRERPRLLRSDAWPRKRPLRRVSYLGLSGLVPLPRRRPTAALLPPVDPFVVLSTDLHVQGAVYSVNPRPFPSAAHELSAMHSPLGSRGRRSIH